MNKQEVRDQALAAKRMPSAEASYRNLLLNQRINPHHPLVSQLVWSSCGGPVDPDVFTQAPVFLALDLSARNDLTAILELAKDPAGIWHTRPTFFTPEKALLGAVSP